LKNFSLGAEDANRLLTSRSTTVIRTEAIASSEAHLTTQAVVAATPAAPASVVGTTAQIVERTTSSHSSGSIATSQ